MSKRLLYVLVISLVLGVVLSIIGILYLILKGLSSITDGVDILRGAVEIAALVVGTSWVLYKLFEYREFMNWIQLEIDKNLYRLISPVDAGIYSWKKGERKQEPVQSCTHAVEVILRFTNKGNTRVKLYNIKISIFTMDPPMDPPTKKIEFDQGSGYLKLKRILTSGNLVPIMPELDFPHKRSKPVEETSFYYIEPGVQQEITYLALIPQPRELLQVAAEFNLEQRRMFRGKPDEVIAPKSKPRGIIGKVVFVVKAPFDFLFGDKEKKLYSHTVARTFQMDKSVPISDLTARI